MHQDYEEGWPSSDVAVINHDDPNAAERVFDELGKHGFDITTTLCGLDLSGQLNQARDSHTPFAVIVSKKDMKAGKVVVKAMETGKYEKVKVKALVRYLDRRIKKVSETPF